MNSSMRNQVSEQEWQLRVELAACYRLVAEFGWDDLIFTHISVRIPGPEHHFLINPYGMMFDEITASDLIKIDQDGNKLQDTPHSVNHAGFIIHSCIHEARHDVGCIIHTHTRAGVAVSAQKNGILPISQQSTYVLSSLAYHDYEGVAVREDEQPRLQQDLGEATFLVLRNHGLLTVGKTVADAFLSMYALETTCQIQLAAQSGGSELIHIESKIVSSITEAVKTQGVNGSIVWPALLRKLDRIDPRYKD
ncbi:class II aldolase/adducin family protein [Vibrio natriegens]|uniref:Class II aldolase n=1 Tax=Vibrio natriegens NBRC 15636 = ATCC 14048 = DSM 759 TaxID=1219067 RepID=A0AAN1CXR1_VIBNA|nr:class II aldolase/adducin family protein [Vibrio natriegens]ALR17592.1 aldolase [Vibrio natriegens NBRC 15636 = ATCC 14048 = DSM 759]ANQ15082.1 class II aldolase [Vibrio natriegens NBRC 15636 = ATCC 14048 = DSM 759]EPM40077.1 aldolase [Vibrio natriegens NBRC 15636 = ATCC 14048 = DSM 759]MDX6029582.1 class II aldolase/adducin family protein [Vibrio natriegens NBRC 15636 = ATCC 14048 = DSM 759]UUI13723.1 class II aldolase/adducin family protein [Vibrio natriegens]